MSPLALGRGVIATVDETGPAAKMTVELDGVHRPALAYTGLVGPVEVGDDVVVNRAGLDLGLGSGGFDLVYVNLTRGLGLAGPPDAHVMKLNYSPLQHAVRPLEEGEVDPPQVPLDRPVAVLALHGQLGPVAWAVAQRAPGRRIGYVQAPGGAVAGALSDTVRALRERGLLAAHVTAGPCFGGEAEAVTVAGALAAGLGRLGWHGALVGPGPGIVGSDSSLGHGGLAALDAAHAALALGCRTVVVPRMSSGDPRPRHRGLSHHSATVLDLLLRPVLVALPPGQAPELRGGHVRRVGVADLEGYRASGLSARTMGRSIDDDEGFFRSALAGGTVLGEELDHGV